LGQEGPSTRKSFDTKRPAGGLAGGALDQKVEREAVRPNNNEPQID